MPLFYTHLPAEIFLSATDSYGLEAKEKATALDWQWFMWLEAHLQGRFKIRKSVKLKGPSQFREEEFACSHRH